MMAKAVEAGEHPKDVAERFGVSYMAAYKACKKFGIEWAHRHGAGRGGRKPPANAEAAIAALGTGKSLNAIAREFRVSRNFIQQAERRRIADLQNDEKL